VIIVINMKNKDTKHDALFKVIKGGPLQVSGNFIIRGIDKKTLKPEQDVYLCRCGGSRNKPFCDGSHRRVGLKD
jgi:CDGSH-type Zn-finger protein